MTFSLAKNTSVFIAWSLDNLAGWKLARWWRKNVAFCCFGMQLTGLNTKVMKSDGARSLHHITTYLNAYTVQRKWQPLLDGCWAFCFFFFFISLSYLGSVRKLCSVTVVTIKFYLKEKREVAMSKCPYPCLCSSLSLGHTLTEAMSLPQRNPPQEKPWRKELYAPSFCDLSTLPEIKVKRSE